MPVAHLSIPTAATGTMTVAALALGVEVESVDFTPGEDTMYVDANGTPLNILTLIRKTGASFHGVTKYVNDDASAPAGTSGDGVPNDLQTGVYDRIVGLMGKPNFK